MKIRDSILVVLAAGIVAVGAILVGFASKEVGKIESSTSDASSDVLVRTANKNLEDIAIGIRDSLDSQMRNQYEMVGSWAKTPTLVSASRAAKSQSLEALLNMWTKPEGRSHKNGVAQGDGDPENDLSPEASRYLISLTKSLAYPELFSTDSRGYVVAASGATGDFDQGPDDYAHFEGQGPKQYHPEPGGELWYRKANESKGGMYIGPVKWDASAKSWGIEIVWQIRDPKDNTYLGQLKAVFDYGKFISQFVNTNDQDLYEIKVVDPKGTVVATSLPNQGKVNNKDIVLDKAEYFQSIKDGKTSGFNSKAVADENQETVFTGYAVSKDVNHHVVVVTKKFAAVRGPIDAFVGQLSSSISRAGTELRQNMILVAVVTATLAFLLAWLLLKSKITVPIAKLTRVSEKLAQGEIEGLQIDVSGNDEIGQFGESFKGVLAAFHLLMEEAENNRK